MSMREKMLTEIKNEISKQNKDKFSDKITEEKLMKSAEWLVDSLMGYYTHRFSNENAAADNLINKLETLD